MATIAEIVTRVTELLIDTKRGPLENEEIENACRAVDPGFFFVRVDGTAYGHEGEHVIEYTFSDNSTFYTLAD